MPAGNRSKSSEMSIIEIILLAAALSIDSMAVSLSGSVSMGRPNWRKIAEVSLILAMVQTLLLGIGYAAGEIVSVFVDKYGKWIGLAMLLTVGIDMIREAIADKLEEERDFSGIGRILMAAIATSIDAAASGASFGLEKMPLGVISSIALATFIATVAFAATGMCCGAAIGRKYGRPARIIAGIVLIVIGIRLVL